MSSKHFCLKWNRFQSNILSAFESLQSTEDLADVTITCEGINIKAHKFILSACSPYFRTIFKENPCSHPIVILKDVWYSDLMAIVNFMYHGEVTVTEDQLPSFLHTAMLLQVSGLMNTNESAAVKSAVEPNIPPKKSKPTGIESHSECPTKKVKVLPKQKKSESHLEPKQSFPSQFEVVEIDKIKAEEETMDLGLKNDINIIENVEVIVEEKDSQGSILEAALEIRDKPSSILERSLTSQAGKSPIHYHGDKLTQLPEVQKSTFIPRKPPEEREMALNKLSEASSTLTFEYPMELFQQRVKTEDHSDSLEVMSPEELNLQVRNIELQPHHSSQCGNCPHCGKIYSNQSALKYHVRLVHSDLTNMYCCHLCPESFDYREGYKKHMAEVHLIRN